MRENIIKSIRFERPDSIPMTFHINDSCWNHYPQEWLKEQMAAHSYLFPEYKYDSEPVIPDYHKAAIKNRPFKDDWGCLWETSEDGIIGTVTDHPLKNWSLFEGFKAPDPNRSNGLEPIDWKSVESEMEAKKKKGDLLAGGLYHGHTFLRLCDLRGYENLIFDMTDDEKQLSELIHMIVEFNTRIIEKYLSIGAEYITYPEDLGMELGPMVSPDLFSKYIKPAYGKMMKPAVDAGVMIHMHSDGDLHTLADDLIDSGVHALNLQDSVNGIEWIKANLTGRVCVDLDIDRVKVTPFGTPDDIETLIRKEVETLGSKEGGLMMIYGLYPGLPLENVEAIMDAMERYAGFFR